MEFLSIKVTLPVLVKVYNKGSIYMEDNNVVKRTKHIHVRFMLIREYVKDEVVFIEFVISEDNHEDILTKNVDAMV